MCGTSPVCHSSGDLKPRGKIRQASYFCRSTTWQFNTKLVTMVESQNETNKPPVLALKQGVCLFQANMNGQHQRQYTPLTGKSS